MGNGFLCCSSCVAGDAAPVLHRCLAQRFAATHACHPANVSCCPVCVQGPAVWALRAQTDKVEYSQRMRRLLEHTPNLDIREGAGDAGGDNAAAVAVMWQRWR
jgi:tRNA U34 5-carboxymethylaminomethyl modifying enzyme MnmG/GidA